MVERGVNHAVRAGRSALQAVEICERAAVDVGACRGEGRRRRIRAREAEYLVLCRDELLDDGGADEAGRAGDEDPHDILPVVVRRTTSIDSLSR